MGRISTSDGTKSEETMTITDPRTVQVADLHGITHDIQSA
jgi:hypothetical protein